MKLLFTSAISTISDCRNVREALRCYVEEWLQYVVSSLRAAGGASVFKFFKAGCVSCDSLGRLSIGSNGLLGQLPPLARAWNEVAR